MDLAAKTENCNRDDPEVAAIIPEDREIEAEISKLKNADDLPYGNILGSSGSEESGKWSVVKDTKVLEMKKLEKFQLTIPPNDPPASKRP